MVNSVTLISKKAIPSMTWSAPNTPQTPAPHAFGRTLAGWLSSTRRTLHSLPYEPTNLTFGRRRQHFFDGISVFFSGNQPLTNDIGCINVVQHASAFRINKME
jgi:hypothetical protein